MEENKHNHKSHKIEGGADNPQAGEEKQVSLKESEYAKLKEDAAKASEYWDRILRLQADFDNTRKRLEREKQEFIKFANEEIISELLNILDDLERTVELAQSANQDLPMFLKGVEMIMAHLYEMLKDYGVKPIDAQGKLFDPNFHEALMQIEDKDVAEHTIVEELQKGYLLNEKVIRTAKVKVAVAKKDNSPG
ncbi:MAG: nucleotide exchange factor GrpE [Candidatus Omnitrophica bacterium]|nr:nucleotide exchange factor GrpE [Candidatus Omnitrophota bacterium]MDD5655289.1 nucleotide exchange factor GrpE [Candidatus Omnitrophota bacterium]